MTSMAAKIVALLFVATYMLELGVTAPDRSLIRAVTQRGGRLVRGLLLMLVLGPLSTYVVVRAFQLPAPAAGSLVLLSVVGLAPLAPKSVRRAMGDVPVSVVLTLLLAVVAIFTAVPTARFLLAYHASLTFHQSPLLVSLLVAQGVPLLLGLVLRETLTREHAAVVDRVLKVVNAAALLAVLLVIVLPQLHALPVLGVRGMLAAVISSLVIAALGWALGGPTAEGRRTLAAVGNLPNIAVGLAIVHGAQARPTLAVAVVGAFVVRALTAVIVSFVLGRQARHGGGADLRPTGAEARP